MSAAPLATLVLAALAVVLATAVAPARAAQPPDSPAASPQSPARVEPADAPHAAETHEADARAEHAEGAHEESLLAFLSRLANFGLLAGGLYYFLRKPIADYLESRSQQIRRELVEAAALKDTATRQLAEIDAKLAALPAEIEMLKQRGADEIKAEEARIRQAADAERQRLVEQTTKQIEMQVRAARRELVDLAADLAVASAKERLRAETTASEQMRLVDRYVAQVRSTHE